MANTNYIDSFEVNGVEIPVRDPGISQWAREPSAPEYTAEDVGAFPAVPGGSAGQVLTKTADGQEWKTPSGVDTDRCGSDHEHPAKRAWAAGQ